jgi:hypothetical protein
MGKNSMKDTAAILVFFTSQESADYGYHPFISSAII